MLILLFILIGIVFGDFLASYFVFGARITEFREIRKKLSFSDFIREFNKFCYSSLYENVNEEGVDLSTVILGFSQWILYRINFLPRKNKKPLRFLKKT